MTEVPYVIVDSKGQVVASGMPEAVATELVPLWNSSRAKRRWQKPYSCREQQPPAASVGQGSH